MVKKQIRKYIVCFLAILTGLVYKGLGKHFRALSVLWRQAAWRGKLKEMGNETHIMRYVVIHTPQNVGIGSRVVLAEFVHIWGSGGVDIGDNTIIAAHVAITSVTHDKTSDIRRETSIRKPVKIGNNVWIGSGAVVLPGIHIGDNAIVGAGAVVTKDISENAVVVGIPAKPVLQK